jgi:hypothetical protein
VTCQLLKGRAGRLLGRRRGAGMGGTWMDRRGEGVPRRCGGRR